MAKIPTVFKSLQISKVERVNEELFSEYCQDLKVYEFFVIFH
jgi:hypothetical protein